MLCLLCLFIRQEHHSGYKIGVIPILRAYPNGADAPEFSLCAECVGCDYIPRFVYLIDRCAVRLQVVSLLKILSLTKPAVYLIYIQLYNTSRYTFGIQYSLADN